MSEIRNPGDRGRQVYEDDLRRAVRERYGAIAQAGGCGCGPDCGSGSGSERGGGLAAAPEGISVSLGYGREDVEAVPEGANMGLGCGNPQGIAGLAPGETVLDLGSGGGFDCFLAARKVGETGGVIGVDMTPEMVSKARANAERGGYRNVDFRLGEIENLPVADNSVDCVISNCVINLSPNKPRVFSEAHRVLKPGGRLAVSDVVATAEIPAAVLRDTRLFTGCVTGAAPVRDIEAMLRDAGFASIRIHLKPSSRSFIRDWAPGSGAADWVASADIEAIKPA